jgi:hypothetical protein
MIFMAIIKPKQKIEKQQMRISLETQLIEKITKYCELLNIKKVDDFFEQAAEYVLSKDKDWQAHTKKQKQNEVLV